MLSMKHAASRPRPPLPSAASGSHLRKSAEADAEIAKRCLENRQQPHIVQRIGEQPADQKFQREVIDPLGAGVVALLLRCQPAVHDAVAQRQRRRLVPVVPGRHAGILADRQPQLGEDRALDLGQRQFVDGLAGRREIRWERVIGQTGHPCYAAVFLNGTRSMPRSKPAGGLRLCNACMVFMQGPGRFVTLGARLLW